MSHYSIHFAIALFFAAILPIFGKKPLKTRLLASVCAPAILYVFFYNYDYALMEGPFPFIISYVGAAYAVCLTLFAISFHRMKACSEGSSLPLIKYVLSFFGAFLICCLIRVIPWAVDTFPLSNVEAVLFTMFAGNNEGAENFVISSFKDKVVLPVLWIFFTIQLIQLIVTFALHRRQIFYGAEVWKFKLLFNRRKFPQLLWQTQRALIIFLGAYAVIPLLLLPGIVMSAPFQVLMLRSVDSELYREHYVHPDSVKIEMKDNPKNLVIIFMESMEKNFSRYTPEIAYLEESSLDFLPGGQNVSGTSWTIAGLTGKLCGIPLNMPMGVDEYLGKLPTYVPYAKCLMDVLADKGYNQLYAQGTDGNFTQKADFWKSHGGVNVHDIKYYKSVGKIPENYLVFWGFEDRKLYSLAKEEMDSLARQNKPFAFYMLTVDTHQPYGFVDDSCKVVLKNIGVVDVNSNHFPEALRCASIQVESFINWMRKQPWFDETVVFVMGDHATPSLSTKAGVAQSDSLFWTNFVINSAKDDGLAYRQGRAYSSLDMFPTILESMGFELENHAIALGKSLYAELPTLLERYGRKTLDSLLRERSIQYDYFLMGR